MRAWDEERGRVGKVQAIKEKLDALKVDIEHAERGYDLNKAAELKYSVMPQLQVRFERSYRTIVVVLVLPAFVVATVDSPFALVCACLERFARQLPSP